MEYLQGLLTTFINDPRIVEWLIYCVAAIAGITFALALYFLFSGIYSPIKAQLNKLSKQPSQHQAKDSDFSMSLEHDLDKLKHIPFISSSFSGDKETKKLLIHAGFHSQNALQIFNAIKLLLLLCAAVAATIFVKYSGGMSTMATGYVFAIIIGGAYLIPSIVLQRIANRRMKELRKHFPDALDLLIVCCEAGLGLLEAFQRVKNELAFTQPRLSEEIGLVCSKVRVGVSMQQALQEFSDRTGLDDIKGLNSVIVQSIKLGTGVASTIRIYAIEYRDKRLQQAEENAAKLGVKMIFPMMCCIWPSFFIVAIGPAILKVMNVWDKAF